MEPDPIAENQTDVTIATLMARKDGDPLMNQAMAASLAYMKKLGTELAEVKASLWSPDALDHRIAVKHEAECRGCSVRKWVEDYKKQLEDKAKTTGTKPSLWSFLASERGLLLMMFAVIVFFALMCARLVLGQEGYHDITHTMKAAHSEVQK